jgi:hypothetical protein
MRIRLPDNPRTAFSVFVNTQWIPDNSPVHFQCWYFCVRRVFRAQSCGCLVKGVVPLYLLEAALWGALSWFWHKRGRFGQGANALVICLAVTVALGQILLTGRQSAQSQGISVLESGEAHNRVSNLVLTVCKRDQNP